MNPRDMLRRAGLAATAAPQPLSGSDMGRVWRVGEYVVKSHPNPPAGMFAAEKRGLEELAARGARTPRVYWAGAEGIVLEYLPPGPADWTGLAEMLARLHSSPSERYGGPDPVFIGSLPLEPGSDHNWPRLWREKRLLPLLALTAPQLGPLAARVEEFINAYDWPAEGPRLIHGDLWNGNVLMSSRGPALIDPSAWNGERAVDLAMMRLFGGFAPTFWRAYQEALPLPPQVRDALEAYQLYFLLVHVHFFGGAYVASVRRVLSRYKAL